MTGFDSKRTAALDKLVEVTEEMGLYKETVSKDEALKMALEALEGKYSITASMLNQQFQAITAIKEALAQPAQEPLGYMNAGYVYEMQQGQLPYAFVYPKFGVGVSVALYTTPPQRPWVGLTKEDKESFWSCDQMTQEEWDEFYQAVETKLKEKRTQRNNRHLPGLRVTLFKP